MVIYPAGGISLQLADMSTIDCSPYNVHNINTAIDVVVTATSIILACSGETYRAEDTALRIGKAFGIEKTEILAFPTGFMVSFILEDGRIITRSIRVSERSLRLSRINEVNSISRAIVDNKLTANQALEMLKELQSRQDEKPLISCLSCALCASAFAVMFGSGVKEFLISFIAGFSMQTFICFLHYMHTPSLIISIFSPAVSATVALTLIRIFGGDQVSIIAGAIMPLLPGVAMTNAMRDTMRGDLVSGIARGAEAFFNAVLIAIGVSIVLAIF